MFFFLDKELSSADEELEGQDSSLDNLESSMEEENSTDHSLSDTAKKSKLHLHLSAKISE